MVGASPREIHRNSHQTSALDFHAASRLEGPSANLALIYPFQARNDEDSRLVSGLEAVFATAYTAGSLLPSKFRSFGVLVAAQRDTNGLTRLLKRDSRSFLFAARARYARGLNSLSRVAAVLEAHETVGSRRPADRKHYKYGLIHKPPLERSKDDAPELPRELLALRFTRI